MAGFFRKNMLCCYVDVGNDEFWYGFMDPHVFDRLGSIDGISRLTHDNKIYRIMEIIGECKDKEHDAIIYLKYESEYPDFFNKRMKEVHDGADSISRADKEAEKWEARRKAEEAFGIPV